MFTVNWLFSYIRFCIWEKKYEPDEESGGKRREEGNGQGEPVIKRVWKFKGNTLAKGEKQT